METRRTKAPTKSSLTITVGDFFISTLRTYSLLTMNKTKKRAYKRSNKDNNTKIFWEGFFSITSRMTRVKYVRECLDVTLTEALSFVKRHSGPEPTPRGSRRPQPSRPSWNSAPLVPDTDDYEPVF